MNAQTLQREIQPVAALTLRRLVEAAEEAGYEVLRVCDLRAALDRLEARP